MLVVISQAAGQLTFLRVTQPGKLICELPPEKSTSNICIVSVANMTWSMAKYLLREEHLGLSQYYFGSQAFCFGNDRNRKTHLKLMCAIIIQKQLREIRSFRVDAILDWAQTTRTQWTDECFHYSRGFVCMHMCVRFVWTVVISNLWYASGCNWAEEDITASLDSEFNFSLFTTMTAVVVKLRFRILKFNFIHLRYVQSQSTKNVAFIRPDDRADYYL